MVNKDIIYFNSNSDLINLECKLESSLGEIEEGNCDEIFYFYSKGELEYLAIINTVWFLDDIYLYKYKGKYSYVKSRERLDVKGIENCFKVFPIKVDIRTVNDEILAFDVTIYDLISDYFIISIDGTLGKIKKSDEYFKYFLEIWNLNLM